MRIHRWLGVSFVLTAGIVVGLAGCKDKETDPKPAVQVAPPRDNNGKVIQAQQVARTKGPELLPFDKAVIIDPAPEGELRPPDVTCNGKKPARIFERIATDLWATVNFKDDQGRRVKYQAVMTTELGEMHIDLYGDIAPNHVRSFVSLARAGYYDGAPFYRIFHHDVEGKPVMYIESGCPKGTGEDGYGSVGYWLRPEFSDKITHEPGTIGACLRETDNRQESDNTGACRFYIIGVALPEMDRRFSAFGKVTKGLDVVHIISKRPADEMDRPKQPVMIKTVTIRTVLD